MVKGARSGAVITRDGVEFLIPNEELVTHQVINGSYSSDNVRLKVPIGIAYDADARKAIALCVEAAEKVERVLKFPAPLCLLKGFGDNAVEARAALLDPQPDERRLQREERGPAPHLGQLPREKIEFPFPQHDVHIREPVEVRVRRGEGAVGAP